MTWAWPEIPEPTFGWDITPSGGLPVVDIGPSSVLPAALQPGTHYRLLPGVHSLTSSSRRTIHAELGTQIAPIFVELLPGAIYQGGSSGHQLVLLGDSLVLYGGGFERVQVSVRGTRTVFRDFELYNWPGVGNTNMVGFANTASNAVIRRFLIHDNGGVPPVGQESDIHAIKCGTASANRKLWVLEGETFGNNGDGVQFGSADNYTGQPLPGELYVAGNYFHDEGENGVDLKLVEDTVIVDNRIEGMTPSSSDSGRGIIIHDGARRVRVTRNVVKDNTGEGIVSTESLDLEVDHNEVWRSGAGNSHGGYRVYSSQGAHVHHNKAFDCPIPYEFSTNPPVYAHDNLTNPEEGQVPSAPVLSLSLEVA